MVVTNCLRGSGNAGINAIVPDMLKHSEDAMAAAMRMKHSYHALRPCSSEFKRGKREVVLALDASIAAMNSVVANASVAMEILRPSAADTEG